MENENETVAEIVKRVRRECNSYPLPNAAGEMLKLVREIEAAHRREIAVKDGERNGILKANASLAVDNDRLRREVCDLCARRKTAEDALELLERYNFGDYEPPWAQLKIGDNTIEGAVTLRDGTAFSIVNECDFGYRSLIDMANLIHDVKTVLAKIRDGGAGGGGK